MFPGSKRQPYVLRFHASVAIAYAEYRGRNDLAQKFREQLKQKLGTGKTACTAEQLEKRALAHWKPDGEQTFEQDQSADATLAGGTGESGQQEQGGNGAGLTMPAVASISRVDPLDHQELTFERAVIHVKHGELHLPAASTKALPQEQLIPAGSTPSDDFRSVNWHGKRHTFTPNQAACVEVLWKCWVGGTPVVGGMEILKRAGVSADRLVDVFRVRDGTRRVKHPAWGTMIVSPSKGAYRLAGEPPQK
jgi:hypothetical protein